MFAVKSNISFNNVSIEIKNVVMTIFPSYGVLDNNVYFACN